MKIILGSQSAGRKFLFTQGGIEFTSMPANIDERAIRHAHPANLTLALAIAKSDFLLQQITEPAILVTSDTVVYCNGQILEKAADNAEIIANFAKYQNNIVQVHSSFCVTNTATRERKSGVHIANIAFAQIPQSVIDTVLAHPNRFNWAGAFDGTMPELAPYVKYAAEDFATMIGIPITQTIQAIKDLSYVK